MKTKSALNERSLNRARRTEQGQAIIEYILLLMIILSISGLMLGSVRSSRDKIWKLLICEISAACPDCRSTESAKAALPNSGAKCKN